MNHNEGYTVTITTTKRTTITRTTKHVIKIAPAEGQQKNTQAAATASAFVVVGKDAGNHKA